MKTTRRVLLLALFALVVTANERFAHAQSASGCSHTGYCDVNSCPAPSQGACYKYTSCDPFSCLCSNAQPVSGCVPPPDMAQPATDMATNPPPPSDSGGCALAKTRAGTGVWSVLALLGLLVVCRRRIAWREG
jgi:hypothetical protein